MLRPTRRQLALQVAAGAVGSLVLPNGVLAQAPQPKDLADLKRRLAQIRGGTISTGRDATSGHRYYNGRFDCVRSTNYVRPVSLAGLRATMEWIAERRFKFAMRGRGHSFEGRSSHPHLVVDLSGLGKLDVGDDGAMSAGAGVTLGEVYTKLARKGRVFPGGTCPTVGLVGHTLGGGIGDFLPMFGYAAQTLQAVTLVTMQGAVLQVSETAIEVLEGNPSTAIRGTDPAGLIRALKGAGQGGFGVVATMQLSSMDVSRHRMAAFKFKTGSGLSAARAVALLDDWMTWRTSLPPATKSVVSSKVNFSRSGNSYGIDVEGLVVLPPGSQASVQDTYRTLSAFQSAPEFQTKNLSPDLDAGGAVRSFLDDAQTTNNPERKFLYGASSMLQRPLSRESLRHLVDRISNDIFVSFYTAGGAATPARETSLHPAEFIIEWSTYQKRRDPTAAIRLRDLRVGVIAKASLPDHGFPNYPDAYSPNYFPDVVSLRALRRVFDPDGLSTSSLLDPPLVREQCG